MSGKGDTPRPVDREKFGANWDHIFRKDVPGQLLLPGPPIAEVVQLAGKYTIEVETQADEPGKIFLYLDLGESMASLTPSQARKLATALNTAADSINVPDPRFPRRAD